MNGFDPIQDTFHVFAGGKVKGTQRPGERFFEPPATSKRHFSKFGCNAVMVTTLALVMVIVMAL